MRCGSQKTNKTELFTIYTIFTCIKIRFAYDALQIAALIFAQFHKLPIAAVQLICNVGAKFKLYLNAIYVIYINNTHCSVSVQTNALTSVNPLCNY